MASYETSNNGWSGLGKGRSVRRVGSETCLDEDVRPQHVPQRLERVDLRGDETPELAITSDAELGAVFAVDGELGDVDCLSPSESEKRGRCANPKSTGQTHGDRGDVAGVLTVCAIPLAAW